MPNPSRAVGARLTRRAVLAGAAAAVGGAVAGCTPDLGGRGRGNGSGSPPSPVEPTVDPDVEVAGAALRDQQAIIELVASTRARHPRLGDLLGPALVTHEAHAELLSEAVPAGPRESPSPSATTPDTSAGPGETSSAGARADTVPRRRVRALAAVVEAERALATATKQHAFRAQSGAFARVLGSMAAAAAQQATVLASAPGREGGA